MKNGSPYASGRVPRERGEGEERRGERTRELAGLPRGASESFYGVP
jgi:hypothetical protein